MFTGPLSTRLRAIVKTRWPLLLLFVTVLSFFFVPAWGGMSTRLIAYSKDWAHFPLFAALAALLLYLWPRRKLSAWVKASRVAGAAFVLAVSVEIIQPLVGRSATVTDALIGAAGSLAAVSVYMGLRVATPLARRRLVMAAILLLVAATAPLFLMLADRFSAWRAFPLLDSFERPVESSRWRADGFVLERVEEHATEGRYALRLSVPQQPDQLPGSFLNDGLMDWSGYRQLNLDVFLEGDAARIMLIRLQDRVQSSASERALLSVELKPGPNRVAVDLAAYAITSDLRPLNLQKMASIGLFLQGARAGDALYLDQLRLSGLREAFQR